VKINIIEIFIIITLIVCTLESCHNKTSISYEIGQKFHEAKSEFIRGFNNKGKEKR